MQKTFLNNITNLANGGYIVRGQCTVISCSEA